MRKRVARQFEAQSRAYSAEQVDARIRIGWSGNTTDRSARIQITGSGRFGRIVLSENTPRDLGRDLDWSLSVNAVPDGSAAELTDLTARGAGIDVAATGKAGRFGQELDGVVRLRIADLRPFTGLFGRPVEGMLAVAVTASQPTPDVGEFRYHNS